MSKCKLKNHGKVDKILIIGAGPITVGQACEFDYSCVQACNSLRKVGYKVVLINSNPATIMTDPDIADVVYIDDININNIEKIIQKESINMILPTMGGQVALNCVMELDKYGILNRYHIQLLGVDIASIKIAESREKFKKAMQHANIAVPRSCIVKDIHELKHNVAALQFPLIIRPSYTLAGSGGNVVFSEDELEGACIQALNSSPVHEILIEEYLNGWKEFELEVLKDRKNNFIVVCAIENVDPMGIHTGDSITVAPIQTLTDRQYQKMRDTAFEVMRQVGIKAGGANIQFAVNPWDGRQVVIEMNPRVSRSSALASKATGFPIAKVASLLAVGFLLDDLKNDLASSIPALFEPTLDYVVTKIPRFNFEKFPGQSDSLTSHMSSVGEVMAIGSTFCASIMKAVYSLDIDINGYMDALSKISNDDLLIKINQATPLRLLLIIEAFRRKVPIEIIHNITFIDIWFLHQIFKITLMENRVKKCVSLNCVPRELLLELKKEGFSDDYISRILKVAPDFVRAKRKSLGIVPSYKRVDTCAAEFSSLTPYLYSSYDRFSEVNPSSNKKVIIIGSGPNRIGQGIEFDYCCVKVVQAVKEAGLEAIIVNCNPETVSTDYDISDKLYFEPITVESILNIVDEEQPLGIILQFGGQTPLKIAKDLFVHGVKILGTSWDVIDLTEDRERFADFIRKLNINQYNSFVLDITKKNYSIDDRSFPVIVRPSYVIGGSFMRVVFNKHQLLQTLATIEKSGIKKVLIDQYLTGATEIDVDCIRDSEGNVVIIGIIEQIEPAGIHSGDSSGVIPPVSIDQKLLCEIRNVTFEIVKKLDAIGLVNLQFAIWHGKVFVLEVNPRASRTVPFISKALQQPYVKIATKCILGLSLNQQKVSAPVIPSNLYCIKHAVIPFDKFPNARLILGPEMHSTGEVMGIDSSFHKAYLRSHPKLLSLWKKDRLAVFVQCHSGQVCGLISILSTTIRDITITIYAFGEIADCLLSYGLKVVKIASVNRLLRLFANNEVEIAFFEMNDCKSQSIFQTVSPVSSSSSVTYAFSMKTFVIMLESLAEKEIGNTNSLVDWHKNLRGHIFGDVL